MYEGFQRFKEPIINASEPGELAAISLAVLGFGGEEFPTPIKFALLIGAIMFLLSAFFIFFYSIYPTWKRLWTGTAITFLSGLICLIASSVFLLFVI